VDHPTLGQDTDPQSATVKQPEGESSQRRRSVRRSNSERREEIGAATLLLMARLGLQGTTVSRIADEVGMEPPSLYAHFSGRHEMLLAAIDSLFERVGRSLEVSSDPDVLVRLREISQAHASFMTGEFEGFVIPIYEFITAPRDSGLSAVVGEKQLATIQAITDMVDEGKRQGSIRPDMDSRLAAWELMICYWAEDIAQLMGIEEYIAADYSARILDLFLRDMAPPTR
jgi:TetR/AcrR family transcriptional regulator, transcriptional repressor of bet genes